MVPSIEDVRTERQFKALTGMSRTEFDQFLPNFTEAYEEFRQEAYEAQEAARQRKPGGGQKGKLVEMSQKLFFILYYWKVYPCYDVLGFQFDMDGSKACLYECSDPVAGTQTCVGQMRGAAQTGICQH